MIGFREIWVLAECSAARQLALERTGGDPADLEVEREDMPLLFGSFRAIAGLTGKYLPAYLDRLGTWAGKKLSSNDAQGCSRGDRDFREEPRRL